MYRHPQREHNRSGCVAQTLQAGNSPASWGSNQGASRLASVAASYRLTENPPPTSYIETKVIDINES